jgi:hypothetical protein
VWDFDETILRIHACGLLLTPKDAQARPLESDVADLDWFRSCVTAAITRGHEVAVASFGHFAVIHAYMERICPGHFGRHNISTPSLVGVADGFEVPGGKVPQLELLLSSLLLDGKEPTDKDRDLVVFFDDSQRNVDRARREGGYSHSYLVPKGGFTRSAWPSMSVRPEDKAIFEDVGA